MLIDAQKYKESLIYLWNKVFGDDYGYIKNIYRDEFKDDILCFAHIENNKAVSAFYLLKNTLKFEGKFYNGYYLYSAATLPEYRKKGLMSKLIKEAQKFCEDSGCDYVSLVPANDELYHYYEKFGFQEAMHYWHNVFQSEFDESFVADVISDVEQFSKFRYNYKGNMFDYSSKATAYAVLSLKKSRYNILRLSDTAYCCFDENGALAYEFICEQEKIKEEIKKLLKTVKDPFCIVLSPYDMSSFSLLSFPNKFGMIYPIHSELKRDWKYTDIYMNLALN